MPTRCKALILHCIDFRLTGAIQQLLHDEQIADDCDVVAVAGAAKAIADPLKPAHRETVLDQIEIAIKLHRICRVLLVNHTDCGAYGGAEAFASPAAERGAHATDLQRARSLVAERFPALEIDLHLARIGEDRRVSVERVG